MIRRDWGRLGRFFTCLRSSLRRIGKWIVEPYRALKSASDDKTRRSAVFTWQTALLGILVTIVVGVISVMVTRNPQVPHRVSEAADAAVASTPGVVSILPRNNVELTKQAGTGSTYAARLEIDVEVSGGEGRLAAESAEEAISAVVLSQDLEAALGQCGGLAFPAIAMSDPELTSKGFSPKGSETRVVLPLEAQLDRTAEARLIKCLEGHRPLLGTLEIRIDLGTARDKTSRSVSFPVYFVKPEDESPPTVAKTSPSVLCLDRAVEFTFEADDDREEAHELLYSVDLLNDDLPPSDWASPPVRIEDLSMCVGEYHGAARARDRAGNETPESMAHHFSFPVSCPDELAPEVDIDTDISPGRGGGDVELIIHATDDCTPAADLVYEATVAGRTYTGLDEVSRLWVPNGHHEIRVTVKDEAGNVSEPAVEEVFVAGLRMGLTGGVSVSSTGEELPCIGGWGGWHADITSSLNLALDADVFITSEGGLIYILPEAALTFRIGRGNSQLQLGPAIGVYALIRDTWACLTLGGRALFEALIGSSRLHVVLRVAGGTYDFGERCWIPFVILRAGWRR